MVNTPALPVPGPVPSFIPVPDDNLLIVGDSERNADMLYAVRAFVPDPFIWFTCRNRPHIVLNDPEFDRVRTEAKHCRAISYSKHLRRLTRTSGNANPGLSDVLHAVLREHRIKKVTVAESFPLGLAKGLRRNGIKVKLRDGPFFPDRAIKSADEIKKISAALVMAEVGLSEGIHALRRAKVGKNKELLLHHNVLTAERLRNIIATAVLQAGGNAHHTIVAAGPQGSDPHERGHGPLSADQPIVIDIFPRSQRTGYFGDVTRTVVRGRATEPVRSMYTAVVEAQESAMRALRSDRLGSEVHDAAEAVLRKHGFKTLRNNGHHSGFFHGTGHGVGLEIHEAPRLSPNSTDRLLPGHVVTIEPGLYYPEIGGVRLEDVALVTRYAPRNLTKFEKQLEI
jgi:Xaa-Pro aminopeptidase